MPKVKRIEKKQKSDLPKVTEGKHFQLDFCKERDRAFRWAGKFPDFQDGAALGVRERSEVRNIKSLEIGGGRPNGGTIYVSETKREVKWGG